MLSDQFTAEELVEIGKTAVDALSSDQLVMVRIIDHRRAIGVFDSWGERQAAIYTSGRQTLTVA